jgi:type III secretory pathway component EscT
MITDIIAILLGVVIGVVASIPFTVLVRAVCGHEKD